MKPIKIIALTCLILGGCSSIDVEKDSVSESFVQISTKNPKYFCLSNGDTYIPIGCNLAAMSNVELMEHYMEELHRNGGNYARVWLNSDFFEIEKEYGVWDMEAVSHIDRLLELADMYGIKIKMCIESFRKIHPGRNRWDTKASYHVTNGGPFVDMEDYITSPKGKEEYLRRLTFLQERYGDNPAIFGWELWNEMNAVEAQDIKQWNVDVLDTVHKMFPKNLVMQSLGSLDREWSFDIYEFINKLPSDDVMQVHRYYDEGAELPQCYGPLDELSQDAINHMLAYGQNKPVILAECGAVMPSHSGPHQLYKEDKEGIILHDFLFAPFFCGAAGPGHLWHWDHYIDKVDAWFQIGRFSNAVAGIDPVVEDFKPVTNHKEGLHVYTLNGSKHILSWCRETSSNWQTELADGIPAAEISGMSVDLGSEVGGRRIARVEVYDPWQDKWTKLSRSSDVQLPPFRRSAVIRITLK